VHNNFELPRILTNREIGTTAQTNISLFEKFEDGEEKHVIFRGFCSLKKFASRGLVDSSNTANKSEKRKSSNASAK
jgi:hypothetical protein